MKKLFTPLIILFTLVACNSNTPDATGGTTTEPAPPLIGFAVINSYPHDTGFYTEGLEFNNGVLYESSGAGSADSEGQRPPYPSAFGVADLKTGKVDRKVS